VAIVSAGPLYSEKVVVGLGLGLANQEGAFTGTDFDVHGADTSEKPDKINSSIQIFRL